MPRPSLAEGERRSAMLRLRLTPGELAGLRGEAAAARVEFADFARRRVLKGRIVVQQTRNLSPEVWAEVRRIGVNVNQIARHMNSEQRASPALARDVQQQLDRLIELLTDGVHEPGDQ